MNRTRLILLAVVGSLLMTSAGQPSRAATASPPQSFRLEVPSPVGRKGPDPKNWAKIDLPYAFASGEVWVKVQPGKQIDALLKKYGMPGPVRKLWDPPYDQVALNIGLDRWYAVKIPAGTEKEVTKRISPEWTASTLPDFVYAHVVWDFPGKVTLTPSDTELPNQLGYLDAIGIRRAWDKQISSSAITIAVIDSGLRGSHEDSGVWKQKTGWDYVNSNDILPGADTEWYNGRACFNGDGHGTQTATIAAGDTNNGRGVAGTGFNTAIMPIRALGTTDGVNCVWVVPQDRRGWAIRTATDRGAQVINMSYTFGTNSLPFESDSILYANQHNVTVVSTAGNDAVDVKYYPCGYDYVICIGGAMKSGSSWVKWYSSPGWGSNGGAAWVDFSAPAVGIEGATANTTTSYKYGTGTSYAAPLVSGVLALLHANGQTTPQAKMDALAATAHPDGWTAFGFIDAGAALWR